MALASRCPCLHPSCKYWHVEPHAALQGVRFKEEEARAVASLLNIMEGGVEYSDYHRVKSIIDEAKTKRILSRGSGRNR